MRHQFFAAAALSGALLFASCDGILDEEVFSALGPSNFLQNEQDAIALLNSALAVEQGWSGRNQTMLAEVPTELFFVRGGSLERDARPLEDFTWDATHTYFSGEWNAAYQIIYRTNLFLDEVPDVPFDEARKKILLAEARFLRAVAYQHLFELFGPVPLITTSEIDPNAKPSRATVAELQQFVADEFRAAAADLPGVASQYGRPTKGAALGLLARWHLNAKQWQEAAAAAKEVMDLGRYALFTAANRADLFEVTNERNSEFIYVRPYVTGLNGNTFSQHVTPVSYQFKRPPKTNFATDWKTYSAFIDTFDPRDQRLSAYMFEYTNTQGRLIKLGKDDARDMKFREDMNATSTNNGGDIPLIRYADVLLMRAEALNELNGPNAESIDLINQVRAKAGLPGLTVAGFPSKESLRDHILNERAWEFHLEALRRQDLIRHGKFIEFAVRRGKVAAAHHVLYPIPQAEIDANSNLAQNPGY